MRKINICDQRRRNAQIGFELPSSKSRTEVLTIDGKSFSRVRLLKATISTSVQRLSAIHGDDLTDVIASSDPEIDIENVGRYLRRVKKIFVTPQGKAAFRIHRQNVCFSPQGEEKSVDAYRAAKANVNGDFPLSWTGRMIPKNAAVRQFVFSRTYQLRHVNGLTFDFLFDMARELHQANALMLLGAGTKGKSPLVMTNGGVPYRAFLEGRITGDKYILLLHLTNLELKNVK